MRIIDSDRIAMVDIDDTVVCWNKSEFPEAKRVVIEYVNGPVEVVPHQPNINTIIKFWKLGYTIIAWSGSGYKWATAVLTTLELDKYVHTVMSKPMYHFDDKPAESWMGPRVWRDPKSGEEV